MGKTFFKSNGYSDNSPLVNGRINGVYYYTNVGVTLQGCAPFMISNRQL